MLTIADLPPGQVDAAITLWERCGLTRPWNDARSDMDRALEGTSSTVLAAFERGVLVGTCMVGHDGHRGWVYYLAVEPEVQGTGVGRRLMDSASGWLSSRGLPKIQLMVRGENEAARGFYRHLGFEEQDVVVLGRRLS